MTRNEFSTLLEKVTKLDYEFGSKFVVNHLPERYRYLINITAIYDELVGDEETFPNEAMSEYDYTSPLTHEEVVSRLWKNNKIPVWIDISIFKADKEFTYFTLLCCNRFSADEKNYYYTRNKTGPFGIKSPVHPPGWKESDGKFDLEIRQKMFHQKSFMKKIISLFADENTTK